MLLIDMDSLWQCETCFHHKANGCDTWCDAGEAYRPAASKLKVIDPESLRPKGEWIEKKKWHHGRWEAWYECSRCGERDDNHEMYEMMPFCILPKFCPNCGADMRKEAHNDC